MDLPPWGHCECVRLGSPFCGVQTSGLAHQHLDNDGLTTGKPKKGQEQPVFHIMLSQQVVWQGRVNSKRAPTHGARSETRCLATG